MFVSQFDRIYLQSLIKYNRLLEQRNKLLKDSVFQGAEDTIQLFDGQMEPLATYIYGKRIDALEKLMPLFRKYYGVISGGEELVDIEYFASADYGSFSVALKDERRRDFMLKHTSIGVHRDDVCFILNGMPLKQTGSQGQKKTFLLALTFAKYEYTHAMTGVKPMLLLDDLFDKLDRQRMSRIVDIVSRNNFGQIFITDTDKATVGDILRNFSNNSVTIKL